MRSLKISTALSGSPDGSDASYRTQWAWDKMEVDKVWVRLAETRRRLVREEPIKVAIVDWGIQLDHEAFKRNRNMVSAARVIPPADGNFSDDDGHGTLLAGTIAGIANNVRSGGEAVPWVRLLAIKFIDALTPPMSENAAEAIRYAVRKGARVINASWDVGLNSPGLRKAVEEAGDQNVLVVVAAGNDGGNNSQYPTFPANFGLPNMISVMATDKEDQKPGFSNYGHSVDIAAPGVNIVSTSPYLCRLPRFPGSYNPAYRSYSGTSPAAAHVSGAAALLLSINPRWTPTEIRERLMDSVDDVPGLHRYCRAGGRLNLYRAVERALQ
jgi:subtilisin family serine protease